jgi:hypothetical protein
MDRDRFTGKSAIRLIERQCGRVIGVAALCAEKTKSTMILFEKYHCRAIGYEEKNHKK